MAARARFTQQDIARLLLAARKAGYRNAKVSIALDGTIELIVSDDQLLTENNEWADLE